MPICLDEEAGTGMLKGKTWALVASWEPKKSRINQDHSWLARSSKRTLDLRVHFFETTICDTPLAALVKYCELSWNHHCCHRCETCFAKAMVSIWRKSQIQRVSDTVTPWYAATAKSPAAVHLDDKWCSAEANKESDRYQDLTILSQTVSQWKAILLDLFHSSPFLLINCSAGPLTIMMLQPEVRGTCTCKMSAEFEPQSFETEPDGFCTKSFWEIPTTQVHKADFCQISGVLKNLKEITHFPSRRALHSNMHATWAVLFFAM